MLFKRAFDLSASGIALLLLLPVMLALSAGTYISVGRPILFRQVREGRGGVPFRILKFRSMRDLAGADGMPLPDEERVTSFGRLIRRFRLDELPAFLSVLRGDMALVGPRPLPSAVLAPLIGREERAGMRPGFTGLAQVSGNTLLSNREKIALDLYYVRNWTMVGDIQILFGTLATIALGERRDERLIERALRLTDPEGEDR